MSKPLPAWMLQLFPLVRALKELPVLQLCRGRGQSKLFSFKEVHPWRIKTTSFAAAESAKGSASVRRIGVEASFADTKRAASAQRAARRPVSAVSANPTAGASTPDTARKAT